MDRLEKTDTQLSYLDPGMTGTTGEQFNVSNYMPFSAWHDDIGVAGKIIGEPASGVPCDFQVSIPAEYVAVSERGTTTGTIDGQEIEGAFSLAAGAHRLVRTGGEGRAAIFLARAEKAGFHPLFDVSAKLVAEAKK